MDSRRQRRLLHCDAKGKKLRTPKRFSRSGFLRRRTACSGTSGDGDRKQSAKNRTAGVSGDVVPNGWPNDPKLERGRRHTLLSIRGGHLYLSIWRLALLRPTSPNCPSYKKPAQNLPTMSRIPARAYSNEAASVGGPSGRKVMEWFSQRTSIAGVQIPNWMIILGAVVVVLIIYNLVPR